MYSWRRAAHRFGFVFQLFLLSDILNVRAHVGQPCQDFVLLKFCSGSNIYCDRENICRCKPGYPIATDPHTCVKPRKNGERCKVSAECVYNDQNSYCNQLPYRSSCECHDEFVFSDNHNKCVKRPHHNQGKSNLVLPTAVGASLALACILCCCLAILHFCRRKHHPRNPSTLRSSWSWGADRNNRRQTVSTVGDVEGNSTSLHANHPTCQATLLRADTLPTYIDAINLQPIDPNNLPPDINESADEPPPCYDDVIKQSELEEDKSKTTCQ